MLVLFDTPAGHALFKVLDESKMKKPDDLWEAFQDVGSTRKLVKLKQFHKFDDTAEAVQSDLLSSSRPVSRFFCGNFGLLLLQQANAAKVEYFLHRMLKVTMMRGAQAAGLVTYQGGKPRSVSTRGERHRACRAPLTRLQHLRATSSGSGTFVQRVVPHRTAARPFAARSGASSSP